MVRPDWSTTATPQSAVAALSDESQQTPRVIPRKINRVIHHPPTTTTTTPTIFLWDALKSALARLRWENFKELTRELAGQPRLRPPSAHLQISIHVSIFSTW